jgi:hypothetical protein
MSMHEALAILARNNRLPGLALDEGGGAAFVSEDGTHIELRGSRDGVTLDIAMSVGLVRAGNARSLMEDVLRANATFLGIASPCFALSGEARELLLTVSICVGEMNPEAAWQAFAAFREAVSVAKEAFSGDELLMG